ncbi:MAG: sugar ABC transporter substrate-binding protein [bacterium]
MVSRPLLNRRVQRLARLIAPACVIVACTTADARAGNGVRELRVWAFGAEGEAVAPMVRDFERANPDVRVRVQQIPWTAAHEKLLTAFVGGALPDVAQLGNTWVPEFQALKALTPLDSALASDAAHMPRADYFPGVLATNVVDDTLYGVPWYVDTRVMFYRSDLLRRAGVARPPATWAEWRDALARVQRVQPAGSVPMLMPLDEWAQPVILALQSGAPLLADHGTRGFFRDARFRRGFEFYVDLFRDGLAPPLANTQVSNVYQEFAAGRIAMYISGPWNVSEFRKRMPDTLQGAWATAPLPGPTEPGVSLAGGSSLVVMRGARHPDDAMRFIAFLSDPARQAAFYEATGDLPARRSAWNAPRLAGDPYLAAFRDQLARVVPTPAVAEWELIATDIAAAAERAARGTQSIDVALAALDAEVDGVLEKRRWLQAHRVVAARPGKR